MPKASDGYGGKFGVQKDRMDKSAETWEYAGKVDKHASQKDYSKGFGGKYGVEADRQDKSALGWDEKVMLAQHENYAKGFGGKYGVQTDRKDKSALGWEEQEKLQQHESQIDYKKGFGGKFGIQEDRKDKNYKKGFGGKFGLQKDRQDKSAAGWDEHEKVAPHESQGFKSCQLFFGDFYARGHYKKGFGGKFGIQEDRVDKSALGWDAHDKLQQHESQTGKILINPLGEIARTNYLFLQKRLKFHGFIGFSDYKKDYKKGFGGQFGLQDDRLDKSAVGYEYQEKLAQHESQKDYSKEKDKTAKTHAAPAVTPKGTALSLRARFEQLAASESDDKVQQERERRKREDEELRRQQQKEEEERQKKIAEEWKRREELAQQAFKNAIHAFKNAIHVLRLVL
ncbi:unnamed protein product [Gongylonema pulchrum]|uniref:Src substrate cortactin n=1 Tax=Gongylonema pulchrum TaxID=637853 RepID=A0A183E6M6_9BILA|nr:unnamed protein product [Gongylonema pulchrum]